ncbi:hypothetical protein ACFVZD_36235 [Streptomyces sp. NPDC058287]|uniref:hypothetical protein n=1 Tax=unclassified Streptomyces TaxID=2593676 RepID=UPI0036E224EE
MLNEEIHLIEPPPNSVLIGAEKGSVGTSKIAAQGAAWRVAQHAIPAPFRQFAQCRRTWTSCRVAQPSGISSSC